MLNEIITHFKGDSSSFQKAANEAKAAAKGFADSTEKDMNRASRTIGGLSKAFLGFYALNKVKNFFMGATKAAAEYSKQLALVKSLTQANAEQMAFLDAQAKKMSTNTTLSSTDVLKAFRITGNVRGELFDNPKELAKATQTVVDLSAATGQNIEIASKVLGSSLNQFQAPTDQIDEFANALAGASKYGAAELDDIAVSLSYIGGVAKQANLDLPQTLSMLEVLSRKGIVGSKAGTSGARVLTGLMTSANLSINPLYTPWEQVVENLKNMNMGIEESKKLFGQWGLKAGLAIVEEVALMKKLNKEIALTNTLKKQANDVNNSPGGKWQRFKNAAENVKQSIGNVLIDTPATGMATDALTKYGKGIDTYGARGLIWWLPLLEDKLTKYNPNENVKGMSYIPNFRDQLNAQGSAATARMYSEYVPKEPQMTSRIANWKDVPASFVSNLVMGSSKVKEFAESASAAAQRLKNDFTNASDSRFDSAKDKIFNEITAKTQSAFDEAAGSVRQSVKDKASEIFQLGEQYKYSTSDTEKATLYDQIGMKQKELWDMVNGSKYQDQISSSMSNGTFSTFGSGGFNNGIANSLEKSIVMEMSKFAENLTEKGSTVTISGFIKVQPDSPTFVKFVKASQDKYVAEEAAGTAL